MDHTIAPGYSRHRPGGKDSPRGGRQEEMGQPGDHRADHFAKKGIVRNQYTHPWDLTPAAAIALQKELSRHILTVDRLGHIDLVAGVDVGFEDSGKITRAAVVTMRLPTLETVEQIICRRPTRFPYVPGLLSFREIPAILAAMDGLKRLPDLLLCDGQGIAHPRRLGLASHLGLLTDIPSIGVAKSRLTGTHAEVPQEKGAWVPLLDGGECIGAVLRSRSKVKPLYISPGHRIGLETAIKMVMACTTKYRLPETTRAAHKLASNLI